MTGSVVYTALFGAHERLLEQDVAHSSSLRFVCFTDNPSLTSSSWEIVHVKPLFAADPRRSQRDIKIRGHQLLESFDRWLYIDNTVRLKVVPEEILDTWLVDSQWAAIEHEAHETLWQEFEANLASSKDTTERINEQLQDYTQHHQDTLDCRPLWNGFFARRNTPEVAAFTDLWFDHVCRYSARDQLSMMIALSERPITVNAIKAKSRNSPWHDWPHRDGETPASKAMRHAKTSGLKPLAEELSAARATIESLEAKVSDLSRAYRSEQDKRWFHLVGLARRIQAHRVARRRAAKQARKRR